MTPARRVRKRVRGFAKPERVRLECLKFQERIMLLYEKYRPKNLDDVVGQPKVVETLRPIMERGVGGQAFWISGLSGGGKSSLARIIAGSIADPWWITEVIGRELSVSKIADLWDTLKCYGGGKGGRAIIVNESHGCGSAAIEKLLEVLEAIPNHACVVFTTTKEGQAGLFADHEDAHPLLSRCKVLTLTNQSLARAFAERCRTIAQAEGLDGQPIEAYVKLAQRCKNNCRAMLQEIEAGAMRKGGV